MHRFAILLIVCAAGCNDQTATPKSVTRQNQQRDVHAKSDFPTAEVRELVKTTIGEIVLEPRIMLNGQLSLLIPQDFSEMDDETLKLKYPSERPTIVYTNDLGSVNVTINHTNNRMPQNEIMLFHKDMDGLFRNLYPSATWFNSGVIDINGREWLTLNLRTPAIDTEIRNINVVGTSLDGRLLLVSFNVTKELEDDWLEPADAIIQSLSVKK